MTVKIQIVSRWNSSQVLWEGEADSRDAGVKRALTAGAYLADANLAGAYLAGADLAGAYLADANLAGAYLAGADLAGADLAGADLAPVRDDLWAVLDAAPAEVPALLTALRESNVDGSVYEGACACLVGTIANARGCHYQALPGLAPNSDRFAERWFLAINPKLSAKHPVVALTIVWIEAWQAKRVSAGGNP